MELKVNDPKLIEAIFNGDAPDIYFAPDVDTLIAEKDALIAELKQKLVEQTTLRVWAEIQLRHNKYKRCLAMGRRFQNAQYYFSVLQDNEASKINSNPKTFKELNRKCKFYARWRARWFMIADNFKEAK